MIERSLINERQTQTGYVQYRPAQTQRIAQNRTDTQTRPPTTHANFTQQETSLERVGVVKG